MSHSFTYRAIQADLARGRIPRREALERRVDMLLPYGVNALCLYLESVVQTDTFPAVGCGDTPVTKAYLSDLDHFCQERNVDLIPILQVLGHQEKLLALDAFAHLGDVVPKPGERCGSNAFLPHVPEVRETLFAWLDELLPCFHTSIICLGCDEAHALGLGRSQSVLRECGVEAVLAEYLVSFYEFLAERDKRMMIWADMLIHYPRLRGLLPREIVIANWGYGTWDEAYEKDNHHFASHARVTARADANWVCGNNMAEYIFPPFQRLAENTRIWQELGEASQTQGFLITDWGSYSNVSPDVLRCMGDMYVLMRLQEPGLGLDRFLGAFSAQLFGREDAAFMEALQLMGDAQYNEAYFGDGRLLNWLPILPALLLDDPASGGSMGRRFGAIQEQGLVRFEADMRRAASLLGSVDAATAHEPDWVQDLQMLAQRLLAIALRARLWYAHAWDTGCIWETEASLADVRGRLIEYLALTQIDVAWMDACWDRECLESQKASCLEALQTARVCLQQLWENRPRQNTLLLHPPRA